MRFQRLGLTVFILGLPILLIALAEPAAAKSYVEGISAIAVSRDGSQVDTWSETYLTPDLANYYRAYVDGGLYQNASLVDSGYADESPYPNDAYFGMSVSLTIGVGYQIISDHYVVAYYTYDGYYYNPNYFESFATGGSDVPSGTDFAPNDGGPLYYTIEYLYLGSTAVQMSTALPSISGLNPSAASVESSGTITATGNNLADLCTGQTTATLTGSGVTLTVGSVSSDGTQAVLDYSIAANASTGNQSLTLRTCFGTSNAATFQVGDPTPVIQSVSPNNWQAGAQTSFTITGSGFGTAPTVTVTGNGVTSYSSTCGTSCDTTINTTVTVAANAPSGIATITVTSTGYYGSGFVSTGGGGSSSASAQATINGGGAAAPWIVLGPDTNGGGICTGQHIDGTTQPVVVGQQIAFTACLPTLPQGATSVTESWNPTQPQGTVVGGYNASTQGGCVVQFRSSACATAPSTGNICGTANFCDFPNFYWVDQGGNGGKFTFTYSYTLNGTPASGKADVTFNVTGLTGSLLMTANMPTDGSGVQVFSLQGGVSVLGTTNVPVSGGYVGIAFTSNATPPSGYNQSFTWVQLINPFQRQYINSKGPFYTPLTPAGGVDSSYPYTIVSPTTTYDSPKAFLPSVYGEGWETFTATMYLMWDPGLPSPCTPAYTVQTNNPDGTVTLTPHPSNCTSSIPVPLSSVTWHWSGCAINTLSNQSSNGTTWIRSTANGCPVETLGAPQPSRLPEWNSTVSP